MNRFDDGPVQLASLIFGMIFQTVDISRRNMEGVTLREQHSLSQSLIPLFLDRVSQPEFQRPCLTGRYEEDLGALPHSLGIYLPCK